MKFLWFQMHNVVSHIVKHLSQIVAPLCLTNQGSAVVNIWQNQSALSPFVKTLFAFSTVITSASLGVGARARVLRLVGPVKKRSHARFLSARTHAFGARSSSLPPPPPSPAVPVPLRSRRALGRTVCDSSAVVAIINVRTVQASLRSRHALGGSSGEVRTRVFVLGHWPPTRGLLASACSAAVPPKSQEQLEGRLGGVSVPRHVTQL